MINAIKLPGLRNSEFTQLLSDILTIVEKANPDTLLVRDEYLALKTHYDVIEALFKQTQGSVITDEMVALDTRRDNAFIGITSIINGHLYSPKPDLLKAAQLLSNQLATFGAGVAADNYQSETATLRNIIADWETKPELAAAITTLGLDEWKTELVTANNLFAEAYLERAKETGNASADTIRSRRLEAYQAFYDLRDHLNAYFTISKGAEPFGSTVKFINGLIDNYNTLLGRRGTDGKGGGDNSTNPDTPATPAP